MKGQSIHIGISDYSDFGGVGGTLPATVSQWANTMRDLCASRGFVSPDPSQSNLLINHDAKVSRLAALLNATHSLTEGDSLVITFAGFGVTPDHEPVALASQVSGWWMFNNSLLFADLHQKIWQNVARGVRVLIVSASCFAGLAAPPLPSGLVNNVLFKLHDAAMLGTNGIKPLDQRPTIIHFGPSNSTIPPTSKFIDAVNQVAVHNAYHDFASFRQEVIDVLHALAPTEDQPNFSFPDPRDVNWEDLGPFRISP